LIAEGIYNFCHLSCCQKVLQNRKTRPGFDY
jgi:hypothetical protein